MNFLRFLFLQQYFVGKSERERTASTEPQIFWPTEASNSIADIAEQPITRNKSKSNHREEAGGPSALHQFEVIVPCGATQSLLVLSLSAFPLYMPELNSRSLPC